MTTLIFACNSCIKDLSNLPDMCHRPKGVGVHIREITRAHDTTDMCHPD